MFGSILLTIVTVMHVYVFWRSATVPFLKRHVSKKLLIGTGMALWAVFFVGRFIGHGSTGTLAMTLEFFGMNLWESGLSWGTTSSMSAMIQELP